jgi:hypothetical protein
LAGRLDDLSGGDSLDPAAGEQALGLVEQAIAGADGGGGRGQPPSGSSALVGITLTSMPSGTG